MCRNIARNLWLQIYAYHNENVNNDNDYDVNSDDDDADDVDDDDVDDYKGFDDDDDIDDDMATVCRKAWRYKFYVISEAFSQGESWIFNADYRRYLKPNVSKTCVNFIKFSLGSYGIDWFLQYLKRSVMSVGLTVNLARKQNPTVILRYGVGGLSPYWRALPITF